MTPQEKEEGWETVCGQEPYDVEPFGKQKRWMKGRSVGAEMNLCYYLWSPLLYMTMCCTRCYLSPYYYILFYPYNTLY